MNEKMRTLSLEEIRQSQLETMKILRDFCEENHLKYFLAYGTLLGAVRHKGYIPWDDDVDVYMPRDDYNYLIKHFNEKKQNSREVISKELCPEFYLDFAKIIDGNTVLIETAQSLKIGVWVDIFPMDYVADNKIVRTKTNISIGFKNLLLLHSSLKPEKRRPAYKNCIIRFFRFITPEEAKIKESCYRLKKKMIVSDKSNAYGLLNYSFPFWGIPMGSVKLFEPPVKLEFEGEYFNAPRKYNKILRYFYGKDYMSLPAEDTRKSNHSYICYWKEKNGNR